jgi:cytochrome c oxidase assembly protein subunit 15
MLAAATTFGLMVVGSYVSGAGYGLACSGWPLCNREVFPTTEATSVQLHFLHRFLALVLGLLLVALAWLGWRTRHEAPAAMIHAFVALGLFTAQSLVGAANIWTRLDQSVGAVHLALATLLWLLLAVLNIRVHRLYALLPMAPRPSENTDFAGALR